MWVGHRVSPEKRWDDLRRLMLASALGLLFLWPADGSLAQQAKKTAGGSAEAAAKIADIFSQVGDQIYEDCIFELSQEQLDVQQALIQAYIQQGADGALARQLAVKQIQPPKLSSECEQVRRQPQAAPASPWETTLSVPKKPAAKAKPKLLAEPAPAPEPAGPSIVLADMKGLPQWDCAPNVDFVTISLNGFKRKLTGGEICNPYEDVVREVPAAAGNFRLGYTIRTGRLFVVSDDPQVSGKTIAWAISGRDVCRNNPDPDCFAARAIGPLPPGEYSFAAETERRVSWGPKTKRNVAGIWLRKLWNKERFSKAADQGHPGARQHRHPRAPEGRDVGSLPRPGAEGLGLCRLADQGRARHRRQRLHRRAASAGRREPAGHHRLLVLPHLAVQVAGRAEGAQREVPKGIRGLEIMGRFRSAANCFAVKSGRPRWDCRCPQRP